MGTKKECEAEVMELRKQIEKLTAQQAAREKNAEKKPQTEKPTEKAVSYTHLTLPTIYSV